MSDRQKEIGTLVVVVLKAQHLHQPSFYKQDPYAEASLSGVKQRTKTAPKGGQHPVWDDELRFPVLADVGKDKANRILELACYKDEQRGEDVLLGKGTVDIEETLKTGEFDDWVPLETSAGARGEIYLELTFYANSPPPVTRRPSKLSPSVRLARPTTQGGRSTPKTSPVTSPQSGCPPGAVEKKPSTPASGGQIPVSLIPAHNNQTPGQARNHGIASVTIAKHRDDTLPPLPADSDTSDSPGNNPVFPAALQPGGRSGSKPVPPQSRSRVTSMGCPLPEMLPEQLNRRTLSESSTLSVLLPSQVQTISVPVRAGRTPSIVVEEHGSPSAFPNPIAGPIQAYMQPTFIPTPTHGYPRTLSPFQPPISPQFPRDASPGQPQQQYDVLPRTSPSHYQQYTQYPSGPVTTQSLSPPQTYPQLQSTQSQQQQLPSRSPLQQPPYHNLSYQQPYVQQQHLQHLSYTQTPHPPQAPQPYQQHNQRVLSPSDQSTFALSYSQAPQQSYFTAPPPPPLVQTPTPQMYIQPHFSPLHPPPPPPPPPPPSYNQDGKGPPHPVVPPSQSPIPPPALSQGTIPPSISSQQTLAVAVPLHQSPTTLSPTLVVPNTAPATSTAAAVRQAQVDERRNGVEHLVPAEPGSTVREAREVLEQGQVDWPGNTEKQGVQGERDGRQVEEERRLEQEPWREEKLKEQGEEYLRQQDVERIKQEEKEHEKRAEERQRKQEEEGRRRREELREEGGREEGRRREGEERCKREEEDLRRKEEEERRAREEYERRREEEYRKQEDERKRREESEHRRQEKIRHEREEAERREDKARRRHAEEAEAERRWQEELARIKARAEQEAADAAFARMQMEAEEAERRRQEEADLEFVRQVQEEAKREETLALEMRRQVEADMEVARREQVHEEDLERRRREERRKRMEEADRELARRLDMELNLGMELTTNDGAAGTEGH